MKAVRLLFLKIIGEYLFDLEVGKNCLNRTQNILTLKNNKFNYINIINFILFKGIS